MAIPTTTSDTTARGPPRPSQLLRLMPRLPQRLTPGCTTAALPMLDTTHTPPTEAAEIT